MDGTKPCPFCAETILLAARKCRFCGEFLDASAPSEAPAEPAVDAQPSRSRPEVGPLRRGITVVVLIALVGLGLYLYFIAGLASDVEARCSLSGSGEGSCSFTNTGWGPGRGCVRVTLSSRSTQKRVGSPPVCSGTINASSTVTQAFTMRTEPTAFCSGLDWRKDCDIDIVPMK